MRSDEERIYAAAEAFQDGDLRALAADADVVDGTGAWRRGRDGVVRPEALRAANVAIRFLREDVAIVHLSGKGRGTSTLLLSRARGAWKIEAAHHSESKD